MKDKLTKHHKAKSYFLIRKVLFISLGIFLALSAVIVPVSVSYAVIQHNVTEAQR